MKFKLLIASIATCVLLISGCSSSSKSMNHDEMNHHGMNHDEMKK